MTDWKEGLNDQQIEAASYIGSNARLLAGPGTGKTKTLTRRVLALVLQHNVEPSEVLVLTFTRVAAHQLKSEIESVLQPLGKGLPHVSTLHSFALRQLLRNQSKLDVLPLPLRIADDWEERNIILENLKMDLSDHLTKVLPDVKQPVMKVKKFFVLLSADWESGIADGIDTQRKCRDPKFIGAWTSHRKIFGYTMRAELVYQLKIALEQVKGFELESQYKYVMIDEFQDLNPCDLAIVKQLNQRRCELFVSGDDDQSIYGFRSAFPTGIRNFPNEFQAIPLGLQVCYRCDKEILRLGEFVANLDRNRLAKNTLPRNEAGEGEVRLLSPFQNQYQEAVWVARKCKEILSGDPQKQILLLLRSDFQNKLSKVLKQYLEQNAIAVAIQTEESTLDQKHGRIVLSYLRLLCNPRDSLAWYTILKLTDGIGPKTLSAIRLEAENRGESFFDALETLSDSHSTGAHRLVRKVVTDTKGCLEQIRGSTHTLRERLEKLADHLVKDSSEAQIIRDHFEAVIQESGAESETKLLTSISSEIERAEQKLEPGAVNILTMHRAKGLSSDIVIIVGAEQEYIPGKAVGSDIADERRLLYVSLTRARHSLFITYCGERVKEQRFTGSRSGAKSRHLTEFLRDSGLKPENPL